MVVRIGLSLNPQTGCGSILISLKIAFVDLGLFPLRAGVAGLSSFSTDGVLGSIPAG
jgi:hypothetical protein